MPVDETSSEDILSEALEFLGGKPVIDEDVISYGPLKLTLAQKQGKANTLLADHLFSPGLFLAERIERNLLDVNGRSGTDEARRTRVWRFDRETVVELGAGSALPSLLMSTLPHAPSLVVITDYPDDNILGNIKKNVARNAHLVVEGCRVICKGYEWGKETRELLDTLKIYTAGTKKAGFDVVILSDLLHFLTSHDVLVSSMQALLAKTADARVYIGAGNYTHAAVCDNFLEKATKAGFMLEEILVTEEESKWLGTMSVSDLDEEALTLRKNNCRYWVARWLTNEL